MSKPTTDQAREWVKGHRYRESAIKRRVEFACRYPGRYEEAARLATRAANEVLPSRST